MPIFKAAVLADPDYSPSYSNLAQLYTRKGFLQSAEQLLLYAVALDDDSENRVALPAPVVGIPRSRIGGF